MVFTFKTSVLDLEEHGFLTFGDKSITEPAIPLALHRPSHVPSTPPARTFRATTQRPRTKRGNNTDSHAEVITTTIEDTKMRLFHLAALNILLSSTLQAEKLRSQGEPVGVRIPRVGWGGLDICVNGGDYYTCTDSRLLDP